jgi:hypothetical protein
MSTGAGTAQCGFDEVTMFLGLIADDATWGFLVAVAVIVFLLGGPRLVVWFAKRSGKTEKDDDNGLTEFRGTID